jgi:hypothetical protein
VPSEVTYDFRIDDVEYSSWFRILDVSEHLQYRSDLELLAMNSHTSHLSSNLAFTAVSEH